MIGERVENFIRDVARISVRTISAAAAFTAAVTVARLVIPAASQSGLGFEQRFMELHGDTSRSLYHSMLLFSYGASLFFLFGVWFRRFSIRGAFVFGVLSGVYVFALLPPIDLFGSALDLLPVGSVIFFLPVVFLVLFFPFLAFVSDRLTRRW
jgi:hypothetical protein